MSTKNRINYEIKKKIIRDFKKSQKKVTFAVKNKYDIIFAFVAEMRKRVSLLRDIYEEDELSDNHIEKIVHQVLQKFKQEMQSCYNEFIAAAFSIEELEKETIQIFITNEKIWTELKNLHQAFLIVLDKEILSKLNDNFNKI